MKYGRLTLIILCIGYINVINSNLIGQDNLRRNTISLNGTWQIAEGTKDVIPKNFDHTVPVPGLVSLASPPFKNVGPEVEDPRNPSQPDDPLREAFWYRRTFSIQDEIPEIAMLKISKAKYGSKVFLNGKNLGEHLPNFTPGFFNVKGVIKRGENELIIRVGSSRNSVPRSIPDGFDYEKRHYIPGIFDNIKLILSGSPHIIGLQATPDIKNERLRVQLDIGNSGGAKTAALMFTIREARSENISGVLEKKLFIQNNTQDTVINVDIPIKNLHLWTPEDPFLYNLEVSTGADDYQVNFGMREFYFDPYTKKAVLNGKPYFIRGRNITLYRFFEDEQCKNLPWDTDWVRNLHRSFKNFHWNSLRYCIGLPPEDWYKIADEVGFLIQDEFPIWYKGGIGWKAWPKELKADELAVEFEAWMRNNWNHPSVVIWDASNETIAYNEGEDQTGKAVWEVRNLDNSNRPWDNSYSPHRAPGDVYEVHPYHFINPNFKLMDMSNAAIVPSSNLQPNKENFPAIINEYGWLWLNRDGTPTTLTKDLYKNLLGDNSTTTQRRQLYAMYLAAETEFWRCHRKAAAVLHFTALGYSRSDGQTSDHFINVEKLQYESEFLKYIPDAFSPVGLMLDEWGAEIKTGKIHDFDIIAINDLEQVWEGMVHLQIIKDEKIVIEKSSILVIPAYGQKNVSISCSTPKEPGQYTVIASLQKKGEKSIKSIRELPFK